MEKIYGQSRILREFIEDHGWNLYDTYQPESNKRPFKWHEFETKGPAKEFIFGHNYIFAPIPEKDQTLRDAYSITKGLGPSLQIGDINEDRWAGVRIINGPDFYAGKPTLFSRLDFDPEILVAFTPSTRDLPESDVVAMFYPDVIDTFQKRFRIVNPNEYGLTTPIPMPFHVEDN